MSLLPNVTNQVLLTAIHETVHEKTTNYALPQGLNHLGKFFDKIHTLSWIAKDWISYGRAKQAPPQQGNATVYAACLQIFSSQIQPLSYPIKLAILAKCTQDLVEHRRQIFKSYKRLDRVIQHEFPLAHKKLSWQDSRLYKFIQRLFDVTTQLFWLTMRVKDIELLFIKQDSLAEHRALRELIEDLQNYCEKVSKNQALLTEDLKMKEELIIEILNKLGTSGQQMSKQFHEHMVTLPHKLATNLPTLGQFLQPLFNPGEVHAIHIRTKKTPTIRPTRFVPWLGQKVHDPISREREIALQITKHVITVAQTADSAAGAVSYIASKTWNHLRNWWGGSTVTADET